MAEEKVLYKFFADFGRGGCLSGTLVSTSSEVESLIGKTVHFGEVLGKHSECSVDIREDHFEIMTLDEAFIRQFEDLELAQGYDPFDYYEEMEDEDDDD
jgi:hypothetical protein